MNKLLTLEEIKEVANEFHIDYSVLRAIIDVESAGKGFGVNGIDPKIQFEPHVFKRYTNVQITNGVEVQTEEWKAFKEAFAIDQEAARLSTSWGLGQIMGFNHLAAGYKSSAEMVKDFYKSEIQQLRGMVRFIFADKRLVKAINELDFVAFARIYNGPLFYKFNYDVRLKKAYENYRKNL